jgi:outer membrane protein OmpA-like peptidoglycan-associated protein
MEGGMQGARAVAAGLAVLMIMVPGAAFAAATLTLVVGGEAFNGPPEFSVTFDGKPVGHGKVDKAIDTATTGRFADATDKKQYTQSFDFTIPDAVFRPNGVVAVSLANEAHDPSDGRKNRELFIRSVAINGQTVGAAAMSMRSGLGVEPTATLGGYLVVSKAGISGIALPAGGWNSAEAQTASNAAPAAAAVPAVKPPPAPSVAEAPVPAQKTAPAPMTAPPVDDLATGAVQQAASTDAAAAAADDAGNPDPEGNIPTCGLNRKFQITGFSRNSNELTPRVRRALDAVAKAIGTQKCVVHLTGYSSTEGDYAHNALFSIERSQKALRYLAEKGVKFRRFSANGVGETTQFGATPGANRRVVVTVSP